MCQICGYSAPLACIARMLSRYGPGCGLCSTPGRNIGFIEDLVWSFSFAIQGNHGDGESGPSGAFPIRSSLADVFSLSKNQLECQLEKARRTCLQNLTECGRFQVVYRQSEVRVVHGIEALRPKLHALRLTHIEVLEQREVHILNAWASHHIAAFVAELSGLSHRIELLECRPAHPIAGRMRTIIGIGNKVRPAGVETGNFGRTALQGDIRAVVDGEGRTR